jgi:ribosomal protein S18 acetylase RimI-like enzyme
MEREARTEEGLPVRPLPDGSDIRKVAEADVPRVADALAQAFYDDPFWAWVYPGDSRRMRRLVRGFDLYLRRVWLPLGECYTTDRVIGGACWMPPNTWHLGALQQLRLLPAIVAISGRELVRLLRVISVVDSRHPHDPHYYLPFIGVEPEWQGRGFGAALMRPILDRCDAEGLSAYLEASTPRNRALYERNGFEVTAEMTVQDSPPLWQMWRKPRGAAR